MHSRTLVTVDIPEVKTDIETDREIQNTISDLETALERCDKDSIGSKIMNRIYLGRFKGMSNTFARAVYQAVDELLEPYSESTENPEYLDFEDHTDDLKNEYENKSVDCIKLPGGKIVSVHNRIIFDKFIIRDGLVYQKYFGQLKHEKRSKTAKKMTALTDYPYKKLYKSFKDFAELERYMDYNDEYLDGFYSLSHYLVSITSHSVSVNDSVVSDIANAYIGKSRVEDFVSQIEGWDEVEKLTDKQYNAMITDKDLPDRIRTALSKNDIYWEAYWQSISELAFRLVEEYSKKHFSEENKNNAIS